MANVARIRSNERSKRCVNGRESQYTPGVWLGPLYCECGCQSVTAEDEQISPEGLTIRKQTVDGYFDKDPYKIIRNGEVVGYVGLQYNYILLDGVEYLGVKAESPLYSLIAEARTLIDTAAVVVGETREIPMSAGSTLEETAAQVHMAEKIELEEMDHRNAKHPGYCKKCHSFCYGDCEAN